MNPALITEPSDTIYNEDNRRLPFCIKQIVIINAQDIIECRVENIPVDTNWIFISGENGFGKNTFLRAIAVGLHGSYNDIVRLKKTDHDFPFIGTEFLYNESIFIIIYGPKVILAFIL